MLTIKVLHVHRFEDSGADMTHILKELLHKFDLLTEKLEDMATKQERFNAILAELNTTTNEIAADYQTLLDEVRNGTVSDESLTAAEENIARLKQIAASNDQPVPGTEIPPATEA